MKRAQPTHRLSTTKLIEWIEQSTSRDAGLGLISSRIFFGLGLGWVESPRKLTMVRAASNLWTRVCVWSITILPKTRQKDQQDNQL